MSQDWKNGAQVTVSRKVRRVTRSDRCVYANIQFFAISATLHLQQLLQAAKLLTLNKTSPQDIETIFDV
jgi:hypothetical protein